MKARWSLVTILLLTLTGAMQARYEFFTPEGSFAIEISLENSTELRLPMYRNAVTSLTVVGDLIIGGTSADPGLSPFLFAASLKGRELRQAVDLEKVIPGQVAISSGFGRDAEGSLYAGTLPQEEGGSGHLLRIRTGSGRLDVEDLGKAVPGEGVFALAFDANRGTIYGITHPSGKFFSYDVTQKKAKVFDDTQPTRRGWGSLHSYSLEPADVLSRALVIDSKGRVYGSRPGGILFRFHPQDEKFETLPDLLPEVWGRRPLNRVDSWAISGDGMLYGGNASDGNLFRINPETTELTNLGKPIMMPRMKALAFAGDGKLYGVAGGRPGYAHLFSYEPGGKGFHDLGNPRFTMVAPGIEQGIFWRGFQIGTMAVSEDGRFVVMGEDEALSQLMVFPVGD